ncbi:MAG: hypothetical protein ACW97W_03765 [Candidatus Hodarchaeales archaeon]
MIPESRGIQVIKTAKLHGIAIKTRPKNTIFKIALIGYPKTTKKHGLLSYFEESKMFDLER